MQKMVYLLLFIAIYSLVYSSDNKHIFNAPVRMDFQDTDHNGLLDDYQMPIYGDNIVRKNEIEDDQLAKIIQEAYTNFFTEKFGLSKAKIIPVLRFSPNSAFRKLTKSEIEQMKRYKK